DFPRLVAYTTENQPDGLVLTFDTPLGVALPSSVPEGLTGLDAFKPDARTLKVKIGARGEVKHYRLMRKIVVDAYSGSVPAPKEKKPETKPAEKSAAAPAAPAQKAPVKKAGKAPAQEAPKQEKKEPVKAEPQSTAAQEPRA